MKKALIGILGIVVFAGCSSVVNTSQVPSKDLAGEASTIFVRPDRFTLLGTRSMADYIEIIYDELSVTPADLPVVRVGLRNKGGQHWWDAKAPDFTLYAQAVFYQEPITGEGTRSAPLYRTNKQAVPMQRGETVDLVFKSPVKGARGYQVVFSEN